MKLRKELWFGFSLMAAIILPVIVLMPWGKTPIPMSVNAVESRA